MEKKHHAFSLFNYEEIIGRFLAITSKFEGPSFFPVKISFEANNMTGPPVITVEVSNILSDASAETIFSCIIDQNTSLEAFLNALDALDAVTAKILECWSENTRYEEVEEHRKDTDGDMPF